MTEEIENTIERNNLQYGQYAQNNDILRFMIDNAMININDDPYDSRHSETL